MAISLPSLSSLPLPSICSKDKSYSNPIHPPYRERSVKLASGRCLGISEFGDPKGKVVIWSHGTPGGRRQVPPLAREYAAKKKLRIIGIERPGTGLSTPHMYDGFADWAKDIDELTDLLDIKHFGAIGLSGGGPYSLALAHYLPKKVTGVASFGGVAPSKGKELAAGSIVRLAALCSPALHLAHKPLAFGFSKFMLAMQPVADIGFDWFLKVAPKRDGEVLSRPDVRAIFMDDLINSGKERLNGVIYDILLFSKEWDFSLQDIKTPVHIWHGDKDTVIPFSHGAHKATLLPNADITLLPDGGHLHGFDASVDAIDFVLKGFPKTRKTGTKKTASTAKKTSTRKKASATKKASTTKKSTSKTAAKSKQRIRRSSSSSSAANKSAS